MTEQQVFPISRFSHTRDNYPQAERPTLAQLTRLLTVHEERDHKDGPLWSPTVYLNGSTRSNASVQSLTALVFDQDQHVDYEDIKRRVSAYECIIHSTFSSTPENPKLRLVLFLSRPVSAIEYPEVRARAEHLLGLAADPATKDPARIYYLPSCPPGALHFAEHYTGSLLDPDTLPSVPGHTSQSTGFQPPAAPIEGTLPYHAQHHKLVSIAGSMRARGCEVDEIEAALQVINERRCEVPGPRENIRRIAVSVCKYPAGEMVTPQLGPAKPSGTYPLTDLGNGERFTISYGEQFRYVEQWGWLVYDGKRWARDMVGERFRAAKNVVRTIYGEAAECVNDERRKAVATWAKNSESQVRIDAMLSTARWEPPITARVEHFDADIYALNVDNGIVDLRTGEIRAHNPSDMITKLAPVVYNPQAAAPLFHLFLTHIIPSAGVRGYLQSWCGYSATGSTREERLSVWHGSGRNGKSTLARTIQHALGEYAKQIDPEVLMEHRNQQHPTGKASLHGVRAAFASETAEGSRLATSTMKALVSNDKIAARLMRQDYFDFIPTHSLSLLTNHKPQVKTTDEGTWRRIDLVPFVVVVPEGEADPDLPEKLQAELPGILAWIISGATGWFYSGLPRVAEITAATAEYREESDTLGDFLAERCVIAPATLVPVGALYKAYTEWCAKEWPLGKAQFSSRLKERGFTQGRSGRERRWLGIGFSDTENASNELF